MKFVKGVMIGGLITTGLVMMYTETGMANKKKTMSVRRHTLRPRAITFAARSFTGSTGHIRTSSNATMPWISTTF